MPKHSKDSREVRANKLSAKIEVEASIKSVLQKAKILHRSIERRLEKELELAEKETAESRLQFMESRQR